MIRRLSDYQILDCMCVYVSMRQSFTLEVRPKSPDLQINKLYIHINSFTYTNKIFNRMSGDHGLNVLVKKLKCHVLVLLLCYGRRKVKRQLRLSILVIAGKIQIVSMRLTYIKMKYNIFFLFFMPRLTRYHKSMLS